jgi:hypothetical protein
MSLKATILTQALSHGEITRSYQSDRARDPGLCNSCLAAIFATKFRVFIDIQANEKEKLAHVSLSCDFLSQKHAQKAIDSH